MRKASTTALGAYLNKEKVSAFPAYRPLDTLIWLNQFGAKTFRLKTLPPAYANRESSLSLDSVLSGQLMGVFFGPANEEVLARAWKNIVSNLSDEDRDTLVDAVKGKLKFDAKDVVAYLQDREFNGDKLADGFRVEKAPEVKKDEKPAKAPKLIAGTDVEDIEDEADLAKDLDEALELELEIEQEDLAKLIALDEKAQAVK